MIIETLTSPIILFFALGMVAAFVRSDLAIPEALAKGMAIYLMAAIGLKGGVSVNESGLSAQFGTVALLGLALSFTLPVLAFALLTRVGGLSRTDGAAVAAHYGSVSLVTFVTAKEMLAGVGLAPAGYMAAVLALMETPAIVTGLLLAKGGLGGNRAMWHEVFTNGSVMLLVGAFAIGLVAGKTGFAPIAPVFDGGYRGVLCLFLLDMGLIAMRRLRSSRALTPVLVGLAIALPLINGTIGVTLATLLGIDPANAAILSILAASASYIAVPAAMRLALPEADPGIYLSMSLGLTFPFNIVFGISLFAWIAQAIGGAA